MARPREWIHRVDSVLQELRGLTSPTLDRRTIEQLFLVSPRNAIRILERFQPYLAGKSLLIDRLELIEKLETFGKDETVRFERNRRIRVAAELAEIRQQFKSYQIKIPTTPGVLERQIAQLPPTIRIAPSHLHVEFQDTQDLLKQLFELAQAIGNDFGKFQNLCEPSRPISTQPFVV